MRYFEGTPLSSVLTEALTSSGTKAATAILTIVPGRAEGEWKYAFVLGPSCEKVPDPACR